MAGRRGFQGCVLKRKDEGGSVDVEVKKRRPESTRGARGERDETSSGLTSVCPTEQNLLGNENNSVGFVYSVRGLYDVHIDWTGVVVGGGANAEHRWHGARCLILSVCRWTSCNFEQQT